MQSTVGYNEREVVIQDIDVVEKLTFIRSHGQQVTVEELVIDRR